MNLPDFSIRKPVTIIVVLLVFVTIGIISMNKLPLELMPDISFPGLSVSIPYPSSSPEEVVEISPEEVKKSLELKFAGTLDNPLMQKIFDAVFEYKMSRK